MIKDYVDLVLELGEDAQSMRDQLQHLDQRKRQVMDKATKPGTSGDQKTASQNRVREIDAKMRSVRDRLSMEQRKPHNPISSQSRHMNQDFEEDDYDEPITESRIPLYDRVLTKLKAPGNS
jgi:hypothetical protein